VRGLGHLIAADGEMAAAQLKVELERGVGPATNDPLMAAHRAITGNLLKIIREENGPTAALAVFSSDGCPLCIANEAHVFACKEPDCSFTFDTWIDCAADDQSAYVATLNQPPPEEQTDA
jgi:hypothetical protein